VLAAALLGGCAGPRLVSSMATTRDGKYRFVWYQNKAVPPFSYTSEQGLVDCERSSSGELKNCQPVKIVFNDKENP
jgi:hypothetical protein